MNDAAQAQATISPLRAALRSVRNLAGRSKWDYPSGYNGPRPTRIAHRAKLHATAFPRSVAPADSMWLDLPIEAVRAHTAYLNASDEQRTAIEHYHREGFWRVDALFDSDEINSVFAAYRDARDAGRILEGTMGRRHLNPQRYVPEIYQFFADRRLLEWVELFMGRPSIPFQTIVGEWGTAQEIHTDAIHQTTFPLGFHVSAWLACEDISLDAGALFYYPRSHRLPYVLAADCGITPADPDPSTTYRTTYVPHIERVVTDNQLERSVFLARKGDVLIWHHNLLHGGSAILNEQLTRKAMALFFYGEGSLHYHDLSGDRAAPAEA